MARKRTALLALGVAATAGLLAGWTIYEARQQKLAIEEELVSQAEVLASTLGPGLTAASNAAREIEEMILWKLLDNARLLAELPFDSSSRIARIAESNGLDSVIFLDGGGEEALIVGRRLSGAGDPGATDLSRILEGSIDEIILDPVYDEDIRHLTVAVRRSQGGAVIARVEALAAQTHVKALGVENLLARLAGSGAVVYLAYSEQPGGLRAEASWDGGPVPPAAGPVEEPLRRLRGREVYEATVPLESPAGSDVILRVGLDGAPLRRAAASAWRRGVLVGTVLAAFGLVATAFALVTRARTEERESAARRLAAAEAGRRRSERLAAAGALTAGLAHEVRSPMNAIGIATQRLHRKLPDGDSRRIAATIGSEVARLETVLREFLELARPAGEKRRQTALDDLCTEVLELLEPEARSLGIDLQLVPGGASASLHPEAVRRALINLVRNALQASRSGDRVVVSSRANAHAVELLVRDRGPGIDPELRGHIFDAFVTGRTCGTGLGLALVKRVADEHQGTISLENRIGGGVEARLRLPKEGSPAWN